MNTQTIITNPKWKKVHKLQEGNYFSRAETLRFISSKFGFWEIFDAIYNLDVIIDENTDITYFKTKDVKDALNDNTFKHLECEVSTIMITYK